MFVLLSTLYDFIAAAHQDRVAEVWMQDELTERHLPMGLITSALVCTAQSGDRILLWRAEVERAGLRVPEKTAGITDAVRARLDTAKALLAVALGAALPRAPLRSGVLLEPGLLAELPTILCEQHVWICMQDGGLSTRHVMGRPEVANAST
jgi:hypothetical protein